MAGRSGAGRVRLVADVGLKARRGRQPVYDAPVLGARKFLWAIMDFLCGKRLRAILPKVIVALERHREIRFKRPRAAQALGHQRCHDRPALGVSGNSSFAGDPAPNPAPS